MKKKGVGSPAYKLGIHIKDYREQKMVASYFGE
jgi:hypothetical protein